MIKQNLQFIVLVGGRMGILRIMRKIEEYYFDKMPTAIWKVVCALIWIVCIVPFIASGWIAHKIWTGLKTGWIISREL